MYLTTFGSNRIYEFNKQIEKTIYKCNQIKYSAYNLYFFQQTNKELFEAKYGNTSLHMILKNKFKIDDYYANSLLQDAKGVYKSQLEKDKLYKSNLKEKLKAVNNKLDKTQKDLNKYIKLRDNLHLHQLETKQGKNKKLKTGFSHISIDGNAVEVRCLNNKTLIRTKYNLYQFEYQYLNKKIKFLRNKLGNLKYRVNNLNNKLNKKIKHIIFKPEHKYNQFSISGRKDEKYGNFVFKATPVKDKFDINIKLLDSEVNLKDLSFKFRGNYLKYILTSNIQIPICYKLIRKIDKFNDVYYQIYVTIDIDTELKNQDISTGLVGLDFNYGHIDLTEINSDGNLIYYETIKYDVTTSSKQNELNLRKAINKAAAIAAAKHKVLCVEKLDTTKSKDKSTYRNKNINRIFHNFAYSKYNQFVDYAGVKYNLEVVKVNPAYTSLIGEVKYKYKCLNNHVAASYVIARRGLKYKELVPKRLKNKLNSETLKRHHWKYWSEVKKLS